ncbi:Kinesin motor domain, partial [Dillenia turbinata]
MPVSTRSQNAFAQEQDQSIASKRSRLKTNQEEASIGLLSNPISHHGLKEKMKALALLYEQQKLASRDLQSPSMKSEEPQFLTHPSVDLFGTSDNDIEQSTTNDVLLNNCTVTRAYVLPQPTFDDPRENKVNIGDRNNRMVAFSCPREAAVMKLSMGSFSPVSETRGFGEISENVQELGTISEKSKNDNSSACGSKIMVFVRLRPMGKKEKEQGSRCCVRIENTKDVFLTECANENDYLRLKRLRGRHFTFDASFSDSTSQQEVYSTTTAELVEAVLQGRNGSVFCYGATGAGKTYTMLGTEESPGVMVLAIKDLFAKIRQKSFDGNHVVHLSYLEVYNETIRDLLSPGRPLVLREDKQGNVAAGLTQYRAYSTDEVMALLQQGNRNRTTEPTRVNETSSRSHAILQVAVEYKVKDASMNVVNRVGKLSLIDLAGSERAHATDQRTLRSIEGANINRSLLALSSCINALVEGKKHIPYRNSKLTQLLKDSLGGACNTVMIANISPSNLSFGETQNTLHWADRAKEIRIKGSVVNEEVQIPENEADQAKLLLELQKENRELRMQLAKQQQKLMTLQPQSLAANSSPTPSSVTSFLSAARPAQPSEKRKTRPLLTGNCFTPESKKKGAEETIRELRQAVDTLEVEFERMKNDHAMLLRQKDDVIQELSRKSVKPPDVVQDGVTRVVTRSSLRTKEQNWVEVNTESNQLLSPAPTAKKRTFWDITTANSPSVATLNGRKTKSHVVQEPPTAPSMLLQVHEVLV